MLQIVWLVLGMVTFLAGVRAAHNPRALGVGRRAVAVLYIGAGRSRTRCFSLLGRITPTLPRARTSPSCGTRGSHSSSRTMTSSSRC